MYHWTEQTDSLRLEFSQSSKAGCMSLLTLPLLFAAMVSMASAFASAARIADMWGVFLATSTITIVVGLNIWLAWRKVGHLHERHGWVEIAIRGGQARWGDLGQPGRAEMLQVERFDVVDTQPRMVLLQAILPGAERRTVLGPWHESARTLVLRVADDLNVYLGRPDDPAAAG